MSRGTIQEIFLVAFCDKEFGTIALNSDYNSMKSSYAFKICGRLTLSPISFFLMISFHLKRVIIAENYWHYGTVMAWVGRF